MPGLFVEIRGQEETRFVEKHGVHACHELAIISVHATQMLANHFIGDGQESAVGAAGALDVALIAEPTNPFVCARRAVASLAALSALKAPRVDIIPATEEGPEQCDLLPR